MNSKNTAFRETRRVLIGQVICCAAMIAVFALFERLSMQTIGILLVNACMESAMIPIFGIPMSVQLFATFAMVPIALYSGRKLSHSRTVQWAFYLFYPVHLLLLWIVFGFVR